MAVNNKVVLQKMMQEVKQANHFHDNEKQMIYHINNIRLLCDLFLMDIDDNTKGHNDLSNIRLQKMNEAEMKMMLGGGHSKQTKKESKQHRLDHDEANGTSIFDF